MEAVVLLDEGMLSSETGHMPRAGLYYFRECTLVELYFPAECTDPSNGHLESLGSEDKEPLPPMCSWYK